MLASYTYYLGDVMVEVIGSAINYPAAPNVDETLNWPTDVIFMNTGVMMVTGVVWKLSRPPVRLPDGRIQVQLRAPTGRSTVTFNVPADFVSVPIWNVGSPVPIPVVEDPPTPADPPPYEPPVNP
jgi:hypothetical protein